MGLLRTTKIFLGAGSESWWLKGLLKKHGGTFTLPYPPEWCLLACSVAQSCPTLQPCGL